jgi:hypothetical protein
MVMIIFGHFCVWYTKHSGLTSRNRLASPLTIALLKVDYGKECKLECNGDVTIAVLAQRLMRCI